MGWLRLVGSLQLQVSFAEYSLFYRALLQKRPIILRSLLIVTTPSQIQRVVMGWLRLVGSLKLLVSFAKEPQKTNDILQKRPVILRSLLIVATAQSLMQQFAIGGIICGRVTQRIYQMSNVEYVFDVEYILVQLVRQIRGAVRIVVSRSSQQ